MFSFIIRVGIAGLGAVILSSCGGSSAAINETRMPTPEGLFTGTATVTLQNAAPAGSAPVTYEGITVAPQTSVPYDQNMMIFVDLADAYYEFYFETGQPINPQYLAGVVTGNLSLVGGGVLAGATFLDVGLQYHTATGASFTGAFNVAQNFAGSVSYPASVVGGAELYQTTTFNLDYNPAYQGIQDLGTLAGTYVGTVGTSQASTSGTFTFSTPTNPVDSGNYLGVSTIVGTGADGCTYTGTVSPLYSGNGYTTAITTGGSPCHLPYSQFTGLLYLDTANHFLYSFAKNLAQSDGVIFAGTLN